MHYRRITRVSLLPHEDAIMDDATAVSLSGICLASIGLTSGYTRLLPAAFVIAEVVHPVVSQKIICVTRTVQELHRTACRG